MKLHFIKKPTFVISSTHCVHHGYQAKAVGDINSVIYDPSCSFQVAWQINPHMRMGQVLVAEAISQHEHFSQALISAGAELLHVPFIHGAFDSVFIKDNAVLTWRNGYAVALFANLKYPERQVEQATRCEQLKDLGISVTDICPYKFEGGDIVAYDKAEVAFLGYGFRTEENAASCVEKFLNKEIITLELIDPHFYHLDTAFTILENGNAIAYKDAFTARSWQKLLDCKSLMSLTCVTREEALKFGLNLVEVGETVIMGRYLPRIKSILESSGKKVLVVPLGQFSLAGGNAACLTSKIHDSSQS